MEFVGKAASAYDLHMDIQETIDSLRKVLESVIAPGVESLRLRLETLEKEVQENSHGLDRIEGRVDHGFARLDSRMDDGFSRLDARIDSLGARLDALTSAILSFRQPTAGSRMKRNTFGPRRMEVEDGQQVSAVEHG